MPVGDLIVLDGSLRMVPTDAHALAAEVAALLPAARAAREAGDALAEWRAVRPAGVGLLVLGRHDEARAALERARDLAVALARPSAEATALVNLGDVHRYAGDPGAAGPLYARAVALARAEGGPVLLAFTLHHHGKHLTEAGRLPEAVTALREAYALRLTAGDAELTASTRDALRAAGAEV